MQKFNNEREEPFMKKTIVAMVIVLATFLPVMSSYALTFTEAPANTKTNRSIDSRYELIDNDSCKPSMIWCTKDGIIIICKKVEDNRYKFLVRMDQSESNIYKFLMEEEE